MLRLLSTIALTIFMASACMAQITEYPLPPNALAGNVCIQSGDTTYVWFTDDPNNAISQMDALGNVTEHSLPTANAGIVGCAFGPDGRVYFVEQRSYKVGAYDPVAGAFQEWHVAAPNKNMAGIVFDATGVLNIMVAGSSAIQRMQLDGTFLPYIPLVAGRYPHGPSLCGGNVWFAESNANRVGTLSATGVVTEFLLPQSNSKPFETTCASDGGVYFTQQNVSRIGRIDLASFAISEWNTLSVSSQPMGITTRYDGNISFTESNSDNVSVMAVGGRSMTETSPPTASALPDKISPCFGISVCFSERAASQLGVY